MSSGKSFFGGGGVAVRPTKEAKEKKKKETVEVEITSKSTDDAKDEVEASSSSTVNKRARVLDDDDSASDIDIEEKIMDTSAEIEIDTVMEDDEEDSKDLVGSQRASQNVNPFRMPEDEDEVLDSPAKSTLPPTLVYDSGDKSDVEQKNDSDSDKESDAGDAGGSSSVVVQEEEKDEEEDLVDDEPPAKKARTLGEAGTGKGKAKSKGKGKGGTSVSMLGDRDFDPVSSASWEKGKPVPYLELSKVFDKINEITKRYEIIELISNFFRCVIVTTPEDLLPAIYLSANKLGPAYEGLELGIGETLLINALCVSTGRSKKHVQEQYTRSGDLGIVAQSSRGTQPRLSFGLKPKFLNVKGVFKSFKEIARMSGHASMKAKRKIIEGLLVESRGPEPQYIIRSLQGKLRIGLAEQSIIMALARAIVLTNPQDPCTWGPLKKSVSSEDYLSRIEGAIDTLKMVYSELPSFDVIIPELLKTGDIDVLPAKCHLTPGIPVKPMLAKPTKGIGEVLNRLAKDAFTCEWKYDGERAQIHKLADGSVHIYSRNAEDNTSKYPDIIEFIKNAELDSTKNYVLDCESVAYDRVLKKILPFQTLSHRARKDVDAKDVTINVCLFAFDILYLNGESLLKNTLRERREALKGAFREVEGNFLFATGRDCDSNTETDVIEGHLNDAIEDSCEGLMVKTLDTDATYEPSKRSYKWLKIKKDYLDGLTDTLDLVPIGAYYGKGKRTGVFGGFLLACKGSDDDVFESVCKAGTGFSDDNLQEFTARLKNNIMTGDPSYCYRFGDSVKADVWFNATEVWEVKAADLSISPTHMAGADLIGQGGKGIALRFPRFVRLRDDKEPDDATNSEQVVDMYRNQQNVTNIDEDGEDYGEDY